MLTVGADAVEVEGRLAGGELECPGCGGVLARWGWARTRVLRGGRGLVRLRPRRARCGGCGGTHVLLPVFALLRRVDLAEVIGAALAAKAAGAGARSIAAAWARRTRSGGGCGGSARGPGGYGRSSSGCWWRSGWIRSRRRRRRRGSRMRSRRWPGRRWRRSHAGRVSARCRRGGWLARPAAAGCWPRAGPGSRSTRVASDVGGGLPESVRGFCHATTGEEGCVEQKR